MEFGAASVFILRWKQTEKRVRIRLRIRFMHPALQLMLNYDITMSDVNVIDAYCNILLIIKALLGFFWPSLKWHSPERTLSWSLHRNKSIRSRKVWHMCSTFTGIAEETFAGFFPPAPPDRESQWARRRHGHVMLWMFGTLPDLLQKRDPPRRTQSRTRWSILINNQPMTEDNPCTCAPVWRHVQTEKHSEDFDHHRRWVQLQTQCFSDSFSVWSVVVGADGNHRPLTDTFSSLFSYIIIILRFNQLCLPPDHHQTAALWDVMTLQGRVQTHDSGGQGPTRGGLHSQQHPLEDFMIKTVSLL